jgi:hypothetical protein
MDDFTQLRARGNEVESSVVIFGAVVTEVARCADGSAAALVPVTRG